MTLRQKAYVQVREGWDILIYSWYEHRDLHLWMFDLWLSKNGLQGNGTNLLYCNFHGSKIELSTVDLLRLKYDIENDLLPVSKYKSKAKSQWNCKL